MQSTKPVAVHSDQVLHLFAFSKCISAMYETEPIDVNYVSTLLAFFKANDYYSRVFQQYIKTKGIPVEEIARKQGIELARVSFGRINEIVADWNDATKWSNHSEPSSSSSSILDTSEPAIRLSHSIASIVSTAGRFSRSLGRGEIEVRDIMAAYIFGSAETSGQSNSSGHLNDLKLYEIDLREWACHFISAISAANKSELEYWKKRFEFRSDFLPLETRDIPEVDPHGLASAHITSDCPTNLDGLEYDLYATAIARFILHPQTAAPLTISIQAPWGGGKTSLMQMIRAKLDNDVKPVTYSASLDINDDDLAPLDLTKNVQIEAAEQTNRVTIWFNAWKYQTMESACAGLADAIIGQIGERLTGADRRIFWWQLNQRRFNRERALGDAVEKTVSMTTEIIKSHLVAPTEALTNVCKGLDVLANLLSLGVFEKLKGKSKEIAQALPAPVASKKDAENGDASKSSQSIFDRYLRKPDYRTIVGDFHNIEEDLRHALNAVPDISKLLDKGGEPRSLKPIVVFVDDLDRCTPAAISGVLEAINLFLAGEFPQCVFVLGMDSELVASALAQSPTNIIGSVPKESQNSMSWKFMDKFVQLAFVIPPLSSQKSSIYARSLFARSMHIEADDMAPKVSVERRGTSTNLADAIDSVNSDPKLSSLQKERSVKLLKQQAVDLYIDNASAKLANEDSEVVDEVVRHVTRFSNNPRQIKRFVNNFRFYYFIRGAKKVDSGNIPTVQQILNWVELYVRWPYVTRWILNEYQGDDTKTPFPAQSSPGNLTNTRLNWLEEASMKTRLDRPDFFKERFEALEQNLPIWLTDEEIFEFFERTKGESKTSLASGAGLGLW